MHMLDQTGTYTHRARKRDVAVPIAILVKGSRVGGMSAREASFVSQNPPTSDEEES